MTALTASLGTDPPDWPTHAEWLTAVAIVADRLNVTNAEGQVVLSRLSLPALLRALPECVLRQLAGQR
jgi:hypothetical protein